MAGNFLTSVQQSVRKALRQEKISEDILVDAIKLDDYLAGQRKKIKRFSGDMKKDLSRVNDELEKEFSRRLEKVVLRSSRELADVKHSGDGGSILGNVGEVLGNNLEDVALASFESVIESGLNVAVNQVLTRKKTYSYETERSKNIAAEFGRSATQQSVEATRVLGAANRNI